MVEIIDQDKISQFLVYYQKMNTCALGRISMFELNYKYTNIFERNTNDIYYQIIGGKLKRRQAKAMIIALGPFFLFFVYILQKDCMKIIDNILDIALDILCLSLIIIAISISTFAWRRFFLYLNRKIYFDRFKDNDPINVNITSDEAYITYHSEKIILLPKYPLFQINKNKYFRVFVYDTQKYIFFTMTNSYYFIYIDKEQFSADKIKELQENLQNIYGKCYVKKY